MKFDIFFSICQTPVNAYTPSERVMFENFFDQVVWADQLGFGCAWIAETHLSCQVQKRNSGAVIPHFEGEIGLNTDILQIAHVVFGKTKSIAVGSAIRNIMCNGGPIAHAEAIKMFLTIQGYLQRESASDRLLEIGFASGRFPFSNAPYGVRPRNLFEQVAWPALRGQVFLEATEIFLRLLAGEIIGSSDVRQKQLKRAHFRTDDDWQKVVSTWQSLAHHEKLGKTMPAGADQSLSSVDSIEIAPFWNFEPVGVIPFEAPTKYLRLTIGAHDAESQNRANEILPVGVFNLSITPSDQIEETHRRMSEKYNQKPWGASDGKWSRALMPRTVLVFIDEDGVKARTRSENAIATYWKAVEGTLDPVKVSKAVGNALTGTPSEIVEQMNARFHTDDRLMLWFDFNNHDNEAVKSSMRLFMQNVAPFVQGTNFSTGELS